MIDAAGKPLGRVAAQAAVLLRGKHKPTFTPNVDCGDHVIIILMATKPTKAMELAVKGMLPKNTLGRNALLRLRLFEGAEHNHQAQKPEAFEA